MKYAAHFWLRPDGSIGKFPVLTFDNNGVLQEARERDEFKEEPGMRMVNGLLIPGFVDIFPKTFLLLKEEELTNYIKRQYLNCTKVIGIPKGILNHVNTGSFCGLEFVDSSSCDFVRMDKSDVFSAFEKLKDSNADIKGLINYTSVNAKILGVEKFYGSFVVGASPGLLSLSKIDYTNIIITENTKIKKIL